MEPPPAAHASPLERIGHYRVLRRLGEGGMGVAYAAEDERLGRHVALKVLRTGGDPAARQRLVREARTAASVSHPLICQVFELGEWNGEPFIAMELLEGEPLSSRLSAGALPPQEALAVARRVTEALDVLHGRGIVHRDLKPSNIFVTPAGVKVLDFGLARPVDDLQAETVDALTAAGTFVGTPQYAAPEQLTGASVDARADLFSAGVILYEMLAGRRPFAGATLAAQVHAVMYETPPVLTGSPFVAAADRLLHRLLAKRPADRPQTAATLLAELGALATLADGTGVAEVRPVLRLAVLPFRMLKPDPETDYLGLSLADALASSLLGFESLVVRSSLKSARYAHGVPDLDQVARDLAVDVVLTGSILRVGDRVRVSAELVAVPGGDVWWSRTTHVPVSEAIEIHDDLARHVVDSLPLTSADRARTPQAGAASPAAFDLYLRGMQHRTESATWLQAYAFFERCLALDPSFAPAWAERGRLDRVLGKWAEPARQARAESAFLRALSLDPDNGAAQYYYAQLEIDVGRLDDALERLLARVRRRRAEPHVYAALVHACRYAGLLAESVAAHQEAQRLDPTIATSVHHTYYMQGDYSRALAAAPQTSDPFETRVLGAMGRDAEALAAARREEERFGASPALGAFVTGLRAALEGRADDTISALAPLESVWHSDGEALFYAGGIYARAGLRDRALAMLDRAVTAGFLCRAAYEHDAFLAPLRGGDAWPALMARLEPAHGRAVDRFVRAGGPSVLGPATRA